MSDRSRSATRRRRKGPTNRGASRAHAPQWYQRRRNQVVVIGIALAVVAAVVIPIALSGGSSHRASGSTTTIAGSANPGQQWVTALTKDLSPISDSLISVVQTTQSWGSGQASGSQVSSQIAGIMPLFGQTLQDLDKQATLPSAPSAKAVAIDAIDLYVAAFRVERAATGLPSGALRQQLQRSYQRIRELGDRIYDLATTIAQGTLPAAASTTTIKPADVPDWVALGLSAGPPLDVQQPPAATTSPTYQVTRPQQSAAGWRAAVVSTGLPSTSVEARDLATGDAVALRQLADQAQAAVVTLDASADPSGDRNASTSTRLGLLVTEEAARAAEAARMATGPTATSLQSVAPVLAAVADQLWDAQLLGPRTVEANLAVLDPATITASP